VASGSGTVNWTVSSGAIASQLVSSGNVDFYVDKVAVWGMHDGVSKLIVDLAGCLANGESYSKSDWGTVDRPAAIGANIPKALATLFSNTTTTSNTRVANATTPSSQNYSVVYHLWVVYRPSA